MDMMRCLWLVDFVCGWWRDDYDDEDEDDDDAGDMDMMRCLWLVEGKTVSRFTD